MQNIAIVSPEPTSVSTPSIGDTERQGTLHVGPTGVIHRGGVPWHKRLALTKAPSPTAHHVMLVLGSFVSDGQSEAWPSVSTLVSMTGLARRSVQRALRALEDDHLVQTETVSGRSSRYRLASTCVTVTPLPASQRRPPCVTVTPEGTKEVVKGRKAAAASIRNTDSGGGKKTDTHGAPVLSKPNRHTCPSCGNDWPASYGTKCFTCNTPVRTGGRLQAEYASRYRAAHHAGQAAPEPHKYDFLEDEIAEDAPAVDRSNGRPLTQQPRGCPRSRDRRPGLHSASDARAARPWGHAVLRCAPALRVTRPARCGSEG